MPPASAAPCRPAACRVFDGGDFLGESMLAHTPKGVAIHLETGTAFDLTAERRRDGFRSIAPGAA